MHVGPVDFAAGFNFFRDTYQVRVGNNAPGRLDSGVSDLNQFQGVFYGFAPVSDTSAGYAVLDVAREIVQLSFATESGQAIYRPRDRSGDYLRQSSSADYGTVQHAQGGRFYPSGLTVFHLVPWSIDQIQFDGHFGEEVSPPPSVPKVITVQRVNR
jgi:hypothetical protein